MAIKKNILKYNSNKPSRKFKRFMRECKLCKSLYYTLTQTNSKGCYCFPCSLHRDNKSLTNKNRVYNHLCCTKIKSDCF